MGRFRDFLSWLGEHFEIIDSSDNGSDVLKDTGSIGDFSPSNEGVSTGSIGVQIGGYNGSKGSNKELNKLGEKVNSAYNPYSTAVQLLDTAVNGYGIYKNYQLQKDALDYQEDIDTKNLDLSERQFAESQYQYQNNYNQQEYWANVSQQNFENATQIRANDLAKAGLNPLLASSANGMEVSPSSSSGVSGSQVSSNAVAPQLDLSNLTQILEGYANRRLERDRLAQEYKLRSKELQNQEKQIENDYELGKEANKNASDANEIRDKEVQEFISNNIRENEVKKMIANEQSRHNQELELLEKMGLDAKRAERVLQQAKQDDDYQLTLKQIELEKQKMEQAKTTADKDRRMQYITKLTHTLFNGVIRIGEALLGVAGKSSSSNPIGFFAE